MLFLNVLAETSNSQSVKGSDGKVRKVPKASKTTSTLDKKATNRFDQRTRGYKNIAGTRRATSARRRGGINKAKRG